MDFESGRKRENEDDDYYGSSNETSAVQAKQLSLKPAAAYRAVSRYPPNAGSPRRGEHGSLARLTGSKVSRDIRSILASRRICAWIFDPQ